MIILFCSIVFSSQGKNQTLKEVIASIPVSNNQNLKEVIASIIAPHPVSNNQIQKGQVLK